MKDYQQHLQSWLGDDTRKDKTIRYMWLLETEISKATGYHGSFVFRCRKYFEEKMGAMPSQSRPDARPPALETAMVDPEPQTTTDEVTTTVDTEPDVVVAARADTETNEVIAMVDTEPDMAMIDMEPDMAMVDTQAQTTGEVTVTTSAPTKSGPASKKRKRRFHDAGGRSTAHQQPNRRCY